MNSLQQTVASYYGFRIPRRHIAKICHTHFIHTERISSILTDNFIGIDDVSTRFTHFLSIWSEDETYISELKKWLITWYNTHIKEEFVPKSCIKEMKNSMLCTTNIAINLSPIFHDRRIHDSFTICWIHIAEIVPARSRPLRHGVGLSLSHEIFSKSYINPRSNCGKRGLSVT